jgi:tetratricopeptide (TPR) repeat protein
MLALLKNFRIQTLKKRGQKLLSRGKIPQALIVFQQLLTMDSSTDILFSLGVALLALNRFEEAEDFFKTVEKEHPENYLNLLSLAEVKLFQNKWGDAIQIYRNLTKLFPDKESFAQQLQIAEDVILREKYVRSKILINEARDALNYKHGFEAIEKLEKALAYNPNNSHLINNIGSVYLLKKEYVKAYHHFEKALSLDPHNRQIQKNLYLVKRKMQT